MKGFVNKAIGLDVKKIGMYAYRVSVLAWRKDGTPIMNVITWMVEVEK